MGAAEGTALRLEDALVGGVADAGRDVGVGRDVVGHAALDVVVRAERAGLRLEDVLVGGVADAGRDVGVGRDVVGHRKSAGHCGGGQASKNGDREQGTTKHYKVSSVAD